MRELFDHIDDENLALPIDKVASRRESVQKALANVELAELEAELELEWPEDPFLGYLDLQVGPYTYRYYYNESGFTGWMSEGNGKPFYSGPQDK